MKQDSQEGTIRGDGAELSCFAKQHNTLPFPPAELQTTREHNPRVHKGKLRYGV